MRRSTDRVLTTHVGSLPYITDLNQGASDYDAQLRSAVEKVVAKQRDIGLDIVNEGEYTKGGDWLNFVETRFGGYEEVDPPKVPLLMQGKDREDFADYYNYVTERGVLFYTPGHQIGTKRRIWGCTGPVTYTGGDELAREIAYLKETAGSEDVFLTSTAPASLEVYFQNKYYGSEDEYLYALADALAVEYKTITDSGVILQVDDAWLPALWDRIGIQMGMKKFRERCHSRVEALNHAFKGIPEDRIRYHFCWGSWKGPHAYDLELKDIVDIMLEVKAQAYVIEGANARHEHEYAVWDDVKLPDGKILIPGMVTHSTDNIEHPELVAQRIRRFADRVGKENVIAGTDCGFGGRSHPQIAWAKLQALVDGAALVK